MTFSCFWFSTLIPYQIIPIICFVNVCLHVTFSAHILYYHHSILALCGVNNGQNGRQAHFLSITLMTIKRTHLITVAITVGINGHGLNNVMCKQTLLVRLG